MHGMNNIVAFGWFVAYIGLGMAMLAVFSRAYMYTTPFDEAVDIPAGKMAPAIAKSGAMLGFTIPLLMASLYNFRVIDYLGWALSAMLVQLIVFRALYWGMPKQIENGNTAVALMFATTAVCAGLINGFSMIP